MNKSSKASVTQLLNQRNELRETLLGFDPCYESNLIKPIHEPEAVEFHEPLPHQPFAGLSLLLELNYFDKKEHN